MWERFWSEGTFWVPVKWQLPSSWCFRWSLKLFSRENILHWLLNFSIRTTYKGEGNYKGATNAIVCFVLSLIHTQGLHSATPFWLLWFLFKLTFPCHYECIPQNLGSWFTISFSIINLSEMLLTYVVLYPPDPGFYLGDNICYGLICYSAQSNVCKICLSKYMLFD